jgi:hypothetical protein
VSENPFAGRKGLFAGINGDELMGPDELFSSEETGFIGPAAQMQFVGNDGGLGKTHHDAMILIEEYFISRYRWLFFCKLRDLHNKLRSSRDGRRFAL